MSVKAYKAKKCNNGAEVPLVWLFLSLMGQAIYKNRISVWNSRERGAGQYELKTEKRKEREKNKKH